MSKYTREQIDKARQLADHAFDEGKEDRKYHPGEPHPGATWIDVFTEALGLDVEDEKPEPGLYLFEGKPVLINENEGSQGSWGEIDTDDGYVLEVAACDPSKLIKARVVPAEPVELSEDDLEAAYPHDEPNAYGAFDAFGKYDRRALVRMCQNLVNKHGHGRAEVTADQVDAAVRSGIATSKADMLGRFTLEDRITSAVMELLEASK